MKTLLMVASLFILVSCESASSDSKKSSSALKVGITLSPSVSAPISWDENSFEILANTEETESESLNGKTYDCAAFTRMGTQYGYVVKGEQLHLTDLKDDAKTVFTRSGDEGDGILGKWVLDESSGDQTMITLSEDNIKIEVKCVF